ncbi:hypothetical protein QYF61_005513 [Mycteria americana]|uniref:Uncharacterized protein n=1 Tax=Mycteria americana TaxID=33587 RepID=A0AAN7NDI8_MYCAM|nr:hypothetical protein QYF61_005513 [Mycteria americana]
MKHYYCDKFFMGVVEKTQPCSSQNCKGKGQDATVTGRRKKSFTIGVIKPRNRLPREPVHSPSVEIFKTHLDKP